MSQFELLQHIPLGICTVSRDYTVLSWNKPLQNWTNTALRDVLGKNLLELYPHLGASRYKSLFDLAFEGEAPYIFSPQLHPHFFPSVLPNGLQRIQRTTAASHTVAGNRRILMICVQDVTNMMDQLQTIEDLQRKTLQEMEARKETLRELEEANGHLVEYSKEKDRIMQILSHDLRSPISGIKAASELIGRTPADTALVSEFSTLITRVSDTLIELINNFLDMARASDGKIELYPDYCDIREIARRAVDVLGVLATGKNILISTSFAEDVPLLVLDHSKMLQVFTNLLSNAIKFTPSGGTISVGIERGSAGDVVVHVADTGIGIPEAHIPMLFEQFGRHQRSGTAGERGTGLGMALVKSLVEMHGGSISVHSEAGQGTTFTMQFPIESGISMSQQVY